MLLFNFTSTTKTVIGFKDSTDKSLQEVFNKLDNWISEGFGWVIESIDGEYVNASIYSLITVTLMFHITVQSFPCCHIMQLNPLKTNLKKITKVNSQIVNSLDYPHTKFPVSIKDYAITQKKISICINVFGYENGLVYPVHVLDEKLKDCMDLFFIIHDNKSYYVYMKGFNRSMCKT